MGFTSKKNGIHKYITQAKVRYRLRNSKCSFLTYNWELLSAVKGFLRAPLLLSHSTHGDDWSNWPLPDPKVLAIHCMQGPNLDPIWCYWPTFGQFKGLDWAVTDTVRSVLDLLSFEKGNYLRKPSTSCKIDCRNEGHVLVRIWLLKQWVSRLLDYKILEYKAWLYFNPSVTSPNSFFHCT